MGNLSRDSVDSYMQTYCWCSAKSVLTKLSAISVNAYIRVYGTDSISGPL